MKSSFIALAVAAALGAGSVPAFAHDHGGEHHQQQWNQRADGDHHWDRRDRGERWEHSRGRYYARPEYRSYYAQPSYYYAQPSYYYAQPQPYYYGPGYDASYDSGDVIGGAILGALAGGLVGQLAAGR